jgi:hypothetical protein
LRPFAEPRRKPAACYAHASQNPASDFYTPYHEKMNRFRGMEGGFELAEGFVRHCQSPLRQLLPEPERGQDAHATEGVKK